MSKANLVVKHNDLIEARHNLSLNQQKMILYTVSKIDRKSDDLTKVRIAVQDFVNLLDVKSTSRYSDIKELSKSLINEPIEIAQPGSNDWLVTAWLSSARYISNEAVIEMQFNPNLEPYLLKLKEKFTQYELQNIINLQSKHSIRLYELLKQYQNIGHRKFTLEEFRGYMNLENSYPETYGLDYHVIRPSIKEINELTDIHIEYNKDRGKGREIIGFSFLIVSKDIDKKIWVEYLEENYEIEEIKERLGLKEEDLNTIQVMNIYETAVSKTQTQDLDPFQYTVLNYAVVKEKKKNIRNVYGYLIKALEEDFANAALLLRMHRDMN